MENIRILLSVALSLTLAACTASRPSVSYVAKGITPADAITLAGDIVAHLAEPLPPAHTTLILEAPARGVARTDVLTPVMIEKLRERGYGIREVSAKTALRDDQGVRLRYLVAPMDNGVVLRLQYRQYEAARFYPRDVDGALHPGAAFAVRNGESAHEE